MYRIRHRIIKPVLITEEGGEKTCMLSFDGYGCVYTQRHTRAKPESETRVSCTRGYQVSVELYRKYFG